MIGDVSGMSVSSGSGLRYKNLAHAMIWSDFLASSTFCDKGWIALQARAWFSSTHLRLGPLSPATSISLRHLPDSNRMEYRNHSSSAPPMVLSTLPFPSALSTSSAPSSVFTCTPPAPASPSPPAPVRPPLPSPPPRPHPIVKDGLVPPASFQGTAQLP